MKMAAARQGIRRETRHNSRSFPAGRRETLGATGCTVPLHLNIAAVFDPSDYFHWEASRILHTAQKQIQIVSIV